jgi:hypothetical protein
MLGRDIRKDQLFPVAELVETQTVAQEGYVAADRFFLKSLPITHRLPLPSQYPEAPLDLKSAKQSLIKERTDQQAAREACLAASERDTEISMRLIRAETARMMLKCDIKLDADEWGLRAPTVKAAGSVRDLALAEFQDLEAQFEPFTAAAARRLAQALSILEVDTVADRVAGGRDRREEAHSLYPCAAFLGDKVMGQLAPTMRAKEVLGLLVTRYSEGKNQKNEPLINAVLRGASDLRDKLEELRWRVGEAVDYPFEHAHEDITVGRFALPPVLPEKDDVGGLLDVAGAAIDRLQTLYRRALGRLTVTAEEVERVVGLEPIEIDEANEAMQ